MPRYASGVRAIELVGLTVVACAVRAVCDGGGHPCVAFLHTPRAAPGAGLFAACPLRRMRTGLMNLQMSLEDEISSVRSMKVAEIKRELSQRGLATDDMFEKEEFVRRLAQARRLSKVPPSTGRVPHARRTSEFDHSRAVLRAHSPLFTRCGNAWSDGDSSRESVGSSSRPNPEADARPGQGKEAAIRAEVESMRVSEIKSELATKGVSTQGLLEKSDFVKLLVQTRLAAPAGGGGSRNPEFKDVQTKKMPKPENAQTAAGPGTGAAGGSGGPFGGMGGGMGGMQNPFAGTGGVSLAHLPLFPHAPAPPPSTQIPLDLRSHAPCFFL
jgi:predicted HTH domain antitoxin